MFHGFILGMDSIALGLLKVEALVEDGRLEQFVKDRYASFSTGIGQRIREKSVTLAELAAEAEKMGAPALPGSGSQEYLESVLNQVLFG